MAGVGTMTGQISMVVMDTGTEVRLLTPLSDWSDICRFGYNVLLIEIINTKLYHCQTLYDCLLQVQHMFTNILLKI